MATEKKQTKARPEKYEQKLAINGSFGQVIKVALGKKEEVAKEREQEKKEEKK